MRVTLQRQSGRPIEGADNQDYNEQWRERFDLISNDYQKEYTRFKKGEITREELDQKSREMHTACDELEKELLDNYDLEKQVELPKTGKQWKEFQTLYGFPSIVHHDGKKVYLIILDVGL